MVRSGYANRDPESDIGSDSETTGGSGAAGNERILRAKYLDWCSARIAERFLQLAPDEIYELAHQSSGESNHTTVATSDPSELGSVEPIASFRRIVARVTEVLAKTVPLPSFEEWSASYRASPARYDEELLGFWKEMVQPEQPVSARLPAAPPE